MLFFLKSWVKAIQGIPKEISIDMGINFGGGDAFMTKHLLNSPQIGATFH
jgi:hypothetical protein